MNLDAATRDRPNLFMRLFLRVPVLLYHRPLSDRLAARGFLLLYTVGNMSKQRRICALNYVRAGGTIYIAAGWGPRTGWYRNLRAQPAAKIRLGNQRFNVEARAVASAEEKSRAAALLDKLDGGPPKALRPLLKRLGFDYEAERVKSLADSQSLTWMALELQEFRMGEKSV